LTSAQRSAISAAGIQTVTLGIRPEQWSTNSGNGSERGIAAEITVVEELGSDAFVYGKLVTDPDETIVVRTSGRSGAHIGDKISLHPISDELHLFHPETGERL
jgi:multiple sugar transport system ATP-binding protein